MGNEQNRVSKVADEARVAELLFERSASLEATAGGKPKRTSNSFFGVGPITDMTCDEFDARLLRFEFDAWLEANYPKLDDLGNAVGNFTTAELARGMHRGYPADKQHGPLAVFVSPGELSKSSCSALPDVAMKLVSISVNQKARFRVRTSFAAGTSNCFSALGTRRPAPRHIRNRKSETYWTGLIAIRRNIMRS